MEMGPALSPCEMIHPHVRWPTGRTRAVQDMATRQSPFRSAQSDSTEEGEMRNSCDESRCPTIGTAPTPHHPSSCFRRVIHELVDVYALPTTPASHPATSIGCITGGCFLRALRDLREAPCPIDLPHQLVVHVGDEPFLHTHNEHGRHTARECGKTAA
jgi:hypothetical protein